MNGLYGAVDVVDSETAGILKKDSLSGLPLSVSERLAVRGHITRKSAEEELSDVRLLGRIWNKLAGQSRVSPVILPTYDCNFRCPYCFERHRLARGQEWLGQPMKPEMGEAVFSALRKQREMGRKIDGCSLYGGEPFLRENRETVRNICEHARAMGLGISGVTNGYDLDSYIDLLEEFRITPVLGIYLDPSFRYYFKAVSEDSHSPSRVTEQQVMDALLAAGIPPMEAIRKQSQYSMQMKQFAAAFSKKEYPQLSPAYCGAEQGMLCIGPDGLLYPCWDLVAMEEEAVGFTDPETGRFFFSFAKAKWRTRTSDLMKPCQSCPYVFICRGGCAPDAKRTHGSCFRENSGELREIFASVASRAAGKKWKETKEDELSVSLAGPLSRLTVQERETLMTATGQKEIYDILDQAGFFFSASN